MGRWTNIFLFLLLGVTGFAQETRIVDSLQDALRTQQGRDKVLTMIELEWEFYDLSFDDCTDWGGKAIEEARKLGLGDLEAKANYVLGIQYAHHADLDLAKEHLRRSYAQNMALADTANAFEALWSIATYELTIGNIDSAQAAYGKALAIAELLNDSISVASVIGNQAIIHYQQGEMGEALNCNFKVREIFAKMGYEGMAMQIDANIATLYLENGKLLEAKKIYIDMLPKLEASEDYYLLQSTCMNLGAVYSRNLFDYDSAMYCFEKSMQYADCQVEKHLDQNRMRVLKSDALSEMANINYNRGEHEAALKRYSEALALAEKESYLSGQMTACIGLGTVYAQVGQASESMRYLNRYFELEAKSGITMMRSATRLPLLLNHARLGQYDALESEISDIMEDRADLVRENADLYDRNRELEETVQNLVKRVERQDALNEVLVTGLQRYRLAFFGLLALALATAIFAIASKIVRKKRAKSKTNEIKP